jgi:hypothetical protein
MGLHAVRPATVNGKYKGTRVNATCWSPWTEGAVSISWVWCSS